MPFHHRPRRRGPAGTASSVPGDLDMVDPAMFFGSSDNRGPDRKTFQLCKQAARALTLALGECGDDVLRDVLVDSVTPAPDASRLLVTVFPVQLAGANTELILEHLQMRKQYLRAAVAAAIHRKRAPELSFCVGWPSGEAP